MKVLVTGASGFIGRRVVDRLVRVGRFDVVTCGRSPDRALGVTHEAADLLDHGSITRVVDRVRPSHLVHLAWNATPGSFWTAPDNLDWAASTLILLRAFVQAGGVRAVIAGSCAEYDWTGEGRLHESACPRPGTFYGLMKDATRRAVCGAAVQLGLSIAWGRVFWLYGPGEAPGRLVSDIANALANNRFVDVSEGSQQRDFLHVDDVAEAFTKALASDWEGPFNIGSGIAVPVRHIVEVLANVSGRPDLIRFGARQGNPSEPRLLVADTRVLRGRIGFEPEIPLNDGLASTYAWWRARRVG